MNQMLVELEDLLKSHDWYYMYSDDHRIWTKYKGISEAISIQMRACEANGLKEQAQELYEKYKQ